MPDTVSAEDSAQTLAVCGIGLSAGGLGALREFFANLGAVDGVSFVIVQHQSAADPAHLNVLASFSSFPVVACEEGMRIVPGHVYVAPAQCLVGIEAGAFTVRAARVRGAQLRTIDYFLNSLGTGFGQRSIGIVFSGNSADGTQGLISIANAGGFTLAQSHETAEYSTMPGSAVAMGVVDRVGSPAELAAAFRDHVANLTNPKIVLRSLAKQELHEICDVVRQATGLDFRHYKESTLFRRVVRRISVLHLSSARDYIDRLQKQPEEARLLTRDLLIGVTAFFRDPDAFESLKEKVLTKLLSGNRAGVVRIWVAGCGSGQEAYSLAMLAQEVKQACGSRQEVQIFATDLDERALAAARRGIYPANIADEVGPDRLERFFERVGRRYRVTKELRQLVVFSPHNLIADPPFSRIDLISCRNLLIYLSAPLQKKLMSVFHYALREGGYLFLGSSEASSGHPELFRVVDVRSRIAQRKETVVPNAPVPRVLGGGQSNWQSTIAEDPADIGRIAQRILLDEFAPSYALAHEDGQIIYLSGKADTFLQPPEGRYVNHIVRMTRGGLRAGLRGAWTKALKTKRTAHFEGLILQGENGRRRVRITVQPMPALGENDGTYMVVFADLGAAEAREGASTSPSADSERMVELLEAELLRTREELERAVQDLEAANEELKSSNEELLSMNEELQSANEELETSKEEVETAKRALEETNADLLNLLHSTEIATIFLDDSGAIRNFTPAASRLYNVLPGDVGRPLSHLTHNFVSAAPLPGAEQLAHADAPAEDEVTLDGGQTFIRRVTPYRKNDGSTAGTVVAFIDISDRKLAERRLATKDAVTRALAECSTLELAATRVLAAICENWDWKVGVLWHADAAGANLSCLQLYQRPTYHAATFVESCQSTPLALGADLVSRVWSSGEPAWVADLLLEPRGGQNDAAVRDGLRSAFAFPIVLAGHRLGVFQFLDDRVRPTAAVLFKMSHPIGSQVGQFIERTNAEHALRESEQRYRAVVESQTELVCRFRPEGNILFANEAYARSQGKSQEEMIGRDFWEFVVPQDRGSVAQMLALLSPKSLEVRIENRVLTTQGERWFLWTNRALEFDAAGRCVEVQSTGIDITERKIAENHRQLLIDELNHRVKNTLAVIQGIAHQTFTKDASPIEARNTFYGRLAALGAAHGLLAQQSWDRVEITALVRSALQASGATSERCVLGGPPVLLEPRHALSIAMALHELSTNAIKYGALSNAAGSIQVSWTTTGDTNPRLRLEWSESGGPEVAPPSRRGFGLMMIERALGREAGCSVQLDFLPRGIVCRIEVALPETSTIGASL
jgi:PAS domain S-box-containing protein